MTQIYFSHTSEGLSQSISQRLLLPAVPALSYSQSPVTLGLVERKGIAESMDKSDPSIPRPYSSTDVSMVLIALMWIG